MVVCVTPPPVPVTVMLCVPVLALCAAVMLIVEVPAPLMDVGPKLTVTPPACPVADNAIVELKPPTLPVVIVDEPLPPRATVTDVGDAKIVKSDFTAAVTVRETVAICDAVPPAPVIVIGYIPALTFEPTVIVIVDVPAPVMDVGLKLTVTPFG